MNPSIRLGKLLGIPIGLHYSFLGILVLVAVLLWSQFGSLYPRWSMVEHAGVTLLTTLLFFSSVVVHEMAHSLVAISKGIPVQGITLFIFGGVSHIAREATRPRVEILVAVVGPLASFALGALFLGLSFLLAGISQPLSAVSWYLFLVNVVLGIFNLVPGFPLDGGRVFRGVAWSITGNYHQATRIATVLGQAVGIILMAVGAWRIAWADFQGMWLILVGWFLAAAALAARHQNRLQHELQGYTARQLLTPLYPNASQDMTLQHLVDGSRLRISQPCVVTAIDGRIIGVVSPHVLRRVPHEAWPLTTARQVMVSWESLRPVAADWNLYQVLEMMELEGLSMVRVVHQGVVLGILGRDSLMRFIRQRGSGL